MQDNPEVGQLAAASQELLLFLWKDILGTQDIAVESNFFEAGGDSLQMMTLLFRISQETGVEIDPGTVFDNPTVAQLALVIAQTQHQSAGEMQEGTI